MSDPWDPERYHRFRAERSRPFDDLLARVARRPGPRILDLGCGSGELTARLHRALEARATVGVDSSERMLAEAAAHAGDGVEFRAGTIETFADDEPFDLVLSNAALHWVEDHPRLLARLVRLLAPGGQLAFQVPANHSHASQTEAVALAREEPFASALSGWVRESPVLAPERYTELLHGLGLRPPSVELVVYPHVLEGPDAVVDWLRGTTLTAYERRLPDALWPRFLDAYRDRMHAALSDRRPLVFPFRRIHAVGALSSP